MTFTVVDSSALAAALINDPDSGGPVAEALHKAVLAAPELLPFEVSNVIRRRRLAGLLTLREARDAYRDLVELPIEFWPYRAFAVRTTELHDELTGYDAPYVALAEALDAPLVTLDRKLARAARRHCAVVVPR